MRMLPEMLRGTDGNLRVSGLKVLTDLNITGKDFSAALTKEEQEKQKHIGIDAANTNAENGKHFIFDPNTQINGVMEIEDVIRWATQDHGKIEYSALSKLTGKESDYFSKTNVSDIIADLIKQQENNATQYGALADELQSKLSAISSSANFDKEEQNKILEAGKKGRYGIFGINAFGKRKARQQ